MLTECSPNPFSTNRKDWHCPTLMEIHFLCDIENCCIRKVEILLKLVSTIVGTGSPGFADGDSKIARLNFPRGIFADVEDNLFIIDRENHTIRRITKDLIVTTLVRVKIALKPQAQFFAFAILFKSLFILRIA